MAHRQGCCLNGFIGSDRFNVIALISWRKTPSSIGDIDSKKEKHTCTHLMLIGYPSGSKPVEFNYTFIYSQNKYFSSGIKVTWNLFMGEIWNFDGVYIAFNYNEPPANIYCKYNIQLFSTWRNIDHWPTLHPKSTCINWKTNHTKTKDLLTTEWVFLGIKSKVAA